MGLTPSIGRNRAETTNLTPRLMFQNAPSYSAVIPPCVYIQVTHGGPLCQANKPAWPYRLFDLSWSLFSPHMVICHLRCRAEFFEMLTPMLQFRGFVKVLSSDHVAVNRPRHAVTLEDVSPSSFLLDMRGRDVSFSYFPSNKPVERVSGS